MKRLLIAAAAVFAVASATAQAATPLSTIFTSGSSALGRSLLRGAMPDGTVVAWRHCFSTDHFHSSSGVISLATIVTVGGCSASDALVDQFADDVGMSSVSGQVY